ncbi:MurR/RpiR family transcriptional regulator [Paenibacillus radicis (ex Xue et al. 2023)]|uniref:MurR/RpiR family transcriptional regulator n=1 Tax=Paenibacillus radicis (ex Xue et al. 2023) TaxID=2972489 RepID=A0ABT1YIX2_9BACL|nr:MurR/RpiR family transcriptional regulator [Paenibacillus radicis (ex Xue et al. 2023)]MCR8633139.1 MurR/RpiR family transcriptional regulator [Paenibacillus radicis (ex Xue et al. 2023)]
MDKRFKWNLENMSANQKKIADFIEKNGTRIVTLTEQDMASELQISIASVSRFWKAAGFKNLKDYKLSLIHENGDISPANKIQNLLNKVGADDLPGDMIDLSIQYLKETSAHLSREDFNLAVQALNRSRHIHIFAPGPSEALGDLLQFRLTRFGYAATTTPKSGRELFEALAHLHKEDTVVIFGFVRMLAETEILLRHAKETGYTTILITDQLVSDMNALADIVLYSFRGQMWEFHSMVAPMALVESLIVAAGMHNKEATLKQLEHFIALRKQYSSYIPN